MLRHEHHLGFPVVRIEHGKVNALDLELAEALAEAAEQLAQGHGPVILTGSGKAFSAGVDLPRLLREGAAYIDPFLDALDRAFARWFELPRPVVAAVNGHAIAGGCILAAACDTRVLAQGSARISAPELQVGVPFPAWALAILEHHVDASVVRRLQHFGEAFLPDAALAVGLVERVVDPAALLDEAAADATRLAAVPPETFALNKAQRRAGTVRRVRTELADHERTVRALWHAESTHGAIAAFLDRTLGK